jgi:hypothetical protein
VSRWLLSEPDKKWNKKARKGATAMTSTEKGEAGLYYSGHRIDGHFADISKMIKISKGKHRSGLPIAASLGLRLIFSFTFHVLG